MACSTSSLSLPKSILPCLFLFALFLIAPSRLQAAETVTVIVEGVDGDPLSNVQAALSLPTGLVREGKIDRRWLEHFSRRSPELARKALEPYGYYRAQVTTALETKGSEEHILRISIAPGEPTRISTVKVELKGQGANEPVLIDKINAFPLRPGELLLQELYDNARNDLLAAARELGYLDAGFPIHEVQVRPEAATASIRLELATGPRYLFGDATIDGATYYPEELLRRYIPFSKGDPFSYKILGQTQLNFAGSPYFTDVTVLPDKDAARDNHIPVAVKVVPLPRRTLRPGVGYGTDTLLRGSLSYRDLSLLYPGHTLNADLTIAQRFQGFGTAYSIPDADNMASATTLQFNVQREHVSDMISRLLALELDRTTAFDKSFRATGFVRLQYEEYAVGLENADSFLLLPGLRLSRRDYDDLIRPTHGWHFSMETRGTTEALGSDMRFIQFIGETGGMLPLPGKLSLQTRAKGAASLLDDPFAQLPTSLRFFAGGDSSVRGYSYKSLGPTDASGEVVGGKHLLQGSVELERELYKEWAVSLFYDAGNAFDEFSTIRIYQGAGVGLHYHTPIGAVNLSLARQIGVESPSYKLHLTIGFQL